MLFSYTKPTKLTINIGGFRDESAHPRVRGRPHQSLDHPASKGLARHPDEEHFKEKGAKGWTL